MSGSEPARGFRIGNGMVHDEIFPDASPLIKLADTKSIHVAKHWIEWIQSELVTSKTKISVLVHPAIKLSTSLWHILA